MGKIKLDIPKDEDVAGTGTQFNFAKLYYESLNQIMLKKEEAAINGDIYTWSRALEVIYRRMCFKINPDALNDKAQKELSDIGDAIEEKFKLAENGFRSLAVIPQYKVELITMQVGMITEILNDIDKKLWYLLDKYKMIFPKFKQMFGLKTYAKKMKLDDE